MIPVEAWDTFGLWGMAVVALGGIVLGLQRLWGVLGKGSSQSNSTPPAAASESDRRRTEELSRVHARLDGIVNEIAEVKAKQSLEAGRLEEIAKTLRLIQEHLLNQQK